VKIGVMELKTLYRAHKFGWYEYECLATCKRLKSKELATVDARGAIKLTVLGLNALVESKKLLINGWIKFFQNSFDRFGFGIEILGMGENSFEKGSFTDLSSSQQNQDFFVMVKMRRKRLVKMSNHHIDFILV